jgi:uncharacterized protein (DUF1697 family)
VAFTSEDADTGALERALERAIGDQLGVRPRVVVRTCAELARVVADNPFPDVEGMTWSTAARSAPADPAARRPRGPLPERVRTTGWPSP